MRKPRTCYINMKCKEAFNFYSFAIEESKDLLKTKEIVFVCINYVPGEEGATVTLVLPGAACFGVSFPI